MFKNTENLYDENWTSKSIWRNLWNVCVKCSVNITSGYMANTNLIL